MNPELIKFLNINEKHHNIVWFEHMEQLCDLMEEVCPIRKEGLISEIKMRIGLNNKSAQEYISAFQYKGLIKKEGVMYIWMKPWESKEKK